MASVKDQEIVSTSTWDESHHFAHVVTVRVEVVGRQFFWVVHYPGPDGQFGRTSPELINTESPLGLDRSDKPKGGAAGQYANIDA